MHSLCLKHVFCLWNFTTVSMEAKAAKAEAKHVKKRLWFVLEIG